MIRAAVALAAVFALPLCSSAPLVAKPAPHEPKTDWVHTFAVTPQGGFRVGKPDAKIAIVEYGSLVCPHCRHFAETAVKPLMQQYVGTGKASYEFRPLLLDGLDLATTLVARCNGPAHFFPMADQLYATQPVWKAKVLNLSAAEQQRLAALPQDQMVLAYAKISRVISIGAAHGIAPARAEACLKDEAAADALVKIEQVASTMGVEGTPTFFVNGKKVPAYDWTTLEPVLKEAGG